MKKIIFSIITACALLCSCEKVIELDDDYLEPIVVANALPCTDSLIFVNITYSRFFLDNREFQPVANATVTIDVNGTALSSTQRDGANYLFDYSVVAGDSLTLHVAIPGHDEITAGTRAVPLPNMTTPLAEIDTLMPISMGDIIFTLTDDASRSDYYYIYVLERDSGTQWNQWENHWDTVDTVRHAYFTCLNREITAPEVNVSEGMMDYYTSLMFSDSLINGQAYDLKVSLPMFRDTAEHPMLKEYTLVVEALGPEAWRYRRDVAASQGADSYFAEPRRIYSNLSSGLGIFAAIARRQYDLIFTYKTQEDDSLRRICNPTLLNIRICNPR